MMAPLYLEPIKQDLHMKYPCPSSCSVQAASTNAAVTSYQGTVAAILPDVMEEEEEGESEDDSINQLSVIGLCK